MIFVLAALLSAFLHPWVGVVAKKVPNALTMNAWLIILIAIVFSPYLFFDGYWDRFVDNWELIIVSNFLKAVYGTVVMYLLGRHSFQVLYPLTRLAPLLLLSGEFLLFGTFFSALQIAGVCAVVLGALIFGFDKQISDIRVRILFFILLIIACVVSFELIDKKLLSVFTPGEIVSFTFFQIPFLVPTLLLFRKDAVGDVRHRFHWIVFAAVAVCGSFYCSRYAMIEMDAAVVSAVRNLSILFGVFLGAHLFDEGHILLRYIAAGLIVVGAGLLLI